MNTKYILPTLFATVGLLLVTPTLEATVLYELNTEFSGGSEPAGATPWATVSITTSGNGVNLTFNTDGLSASEFITEWDLNFSGDASLLAFTPNPNNTRVATISTGNDQFKADGDNGKYDIEFKFPSTGKNGGIERLTKDLSVSYTITSSSGPITEGMFDVTNAPSTKGGPYHTAAHVQGIAPEGSGWIADGGNIAVPEPSTYLMLGSFVALAAFLKRKKKAKI